MSTLNPTPAEPLSHPLLSAVGCPPSGNGALLYLQQLAHSLDACQLAGVGASAQEWLQLTRQLSNTVVINKPEASASPTASDLTSEPWGSVHRCIEARRLVKARSTRGLDVLFAQIVLHAAAGGKAASETTLQGLKMSYAALSGRRKLHEEWSLLATPSLIEKGQLTDLLKGLSHPPVRTFACSLLSYLEQAMPSLAGLTASTELIAKDVQKAGDVLDLINAPFEPTDATQSTRFPDPDQEATSTVDVKEFQRGDSIIEWQIKRASYAKRSNRLALATWASLPVEDTCRITSRLPCLMADRHSPWRQSAALATVGLLTSTPLHIVLHATVNGEGDVNINLTNREFSWSMKSLRGTKSQITLPQSTWAINIPLPNCLADALKDLMQEREANELRHLSDVFGVEPGTVAWSALLKQTHDLLKDLSESIFPAFPGRWSNSISRVYLDVHDSDLFAATCSLDLALTSRAALYYFHPSEQDIRDASSKVYERLGLGHCVPGTAVGHGRSIPSDDQIRAGFERMHVRSRALLSSTKHIKTDLESAIQSLNELTQLSAAMTVFSVAGRGSKVEEITWGALFCHRDFMWLEDKKVEFESSSRILPKVSFLQIALHRMFIARQAVAEELAVRLRRDLATQWKEVASGQLRFDAPAFEYITLKFGKVTRKPVTASDLEEISRQYFQAEKNFMRHVLVTHWAIAGKDRYLLRLITGHSMAGLALPAAGSMYTPDSAARAAGEILEDLLATWLPSKKDKVPPPDFYKFAALPGRRILKVHLAHRAHLNKWGAPIFSRWHLASIRIVERVRQLLIDGHRPSNPLARLWLHLVTFDSIFETGDLTYVFGNLDKSLALGSGGWVTRIQRHDTRHSLVAPAQIPTSIQLHQLQEDDGLKALVDYDKVLTEVTNWLEKATTDCWGGNAERADEGLLACTRLWADWHLPSAVQMCYSPDSHAPVLDGRSNAQLFGLQTAIDSGNASRKSYHNSSNNLLSAFFKVINRLGSSKYKLGEKRKRAQLFERWVTLAKVPAEGELTCALVKASMINVDRIRASKKSAIKWSSMATYFSTLREYLSEVRDLDPENADALELHEFCVDLLTFSNDKDKQTTTSAEAAIWLLDALREAGYPLPSRDQLSHVKKHPASTITTSTVSITQKQIDQACEALLELGGSPLEQARAEAAIRLLCEVPIRWGELAATHRSDVTINGDSRITTNGFSHLKSFSARRRTRLQGHALSSQRSLMQQLDALDRCGESESMLFGSKKLPGESEFVDSARLRYEITSAFRVATNNPKFRIHALRAHAISERLLPNWMNAILSAQQGDFGPLNANALFRYRQQRAWTPEDTRLVAGHAAIQTTLSHYFNAWLPIRSLAVMATMENVRISESLLKSLGVSSTALTKAGTRDPQFRRDPWLYLQRKLASMNQRVFEKSAAAKEAERSLAPAGDPSADEPAKDVPASRPVLNNAAQDSSSHLVRKVRYLGLRLMGLDMRAALNFLGSQSNESTEAIEVILARSEHAREASLLRSRLKGDITGRALTADIKLLRSSKASDLICLLSQAPSESVRLLLSILSPQHQCVNWSEELVTTAQCLQGAPVCLEVVSDIRRVDPSLNHRLSQTPGLIVGSPAHHVGPFPRIFVQAIDPNERSTVGKARWTTLMRVVCSALLILDEQIIR